MNVLDPKRRAAIVSCLVEGNSIRATCRMTGGAKGTVLKLLADIGEACLAYHDDHVRGVKSRRVQCDEIWSFVGAKEKNVPDDERGRGRGSIWTWTALDADTKLIVSYHVGTRDAVCAYEFMRDLASRLASRVQLTTDGHKAYVNAVADAFPKGGIDYAMLVKLYGEGPRDESRYSPAKCIGAQLVPIQGEPVSAATTARASGSSMALRACDTSSSSQKLSSHRISGYGIGLP